MTHRSIVLLFLALFGVPMTATAIAAEFSDLYTPRFNNNDYCSFLKNYELAFRNKQPGLTKRMLRLDRMKNQICRMQFWESPQLKELCDQGHYGCTTISHEMLGEARPHATEKAFYHFYAVKRSAIDECVKRANSYWHNTTRIQSKLTQARSLTPRFENVFGYYVFVPVICAIYGVVFKEDSEQCYQQVLNDVIASLEHKLTVARSFHKMCSEL
jgi:hypothetical protein